MKSATEAFGFAPYCLGCFSEIPQDHFNKRFGSENCPRCDNDFAGSKWYSNPVPKHVIELIKAAMTTEIDKDIDLRDYEIHECSKCQFDNKLGFCPKCDTQSCYP